MIVPWIKGLLSWRKVPMTWTLMVLNLLIFLQTHQSGLMTVAPELEQKETMVLTGKLFYQFQHPTEKELPVLPVRQWLILSNRAMVDPEFIENAPSFQFFGDQVAIERWKTHIKQYIRQLKQKNTFVFGLRSDSPALTWVTYQFMHANWFHLFGNMMMFWIFGAALEMTIGSIGLIFIYLSSGLAGAFAFQFLGTGTLAPMIGASGALSGVMAFYAAFEKKRRIAYFYFASPFPGYFGRIYLPTHLIFPLCFLSDLAGYLSTSAELGSGIAYTAHLGGALLGAALGFALKSFRKNLWLQWFFQH